MRDAQYHKTRMEKISKEDEHGYIYSNEEHEKLILEQFEGFKYRMDLWKDSLVDNMRIRAGLNKGSDYSADIKLNANNNKLSKEIDFFSHLVGLRKIRNEPYAYRLKADETLFFQNFDIANDPIEKLEKGLNKADLINAGKNELFNALLVFSSRKKALFIKKYHPGLRKILNQTINQKNNVPPHTKVSRTFSS